jgi:co-chaperonin GroES (HSP10)
MTMSEEENAAVDNESAYKATQLPRPVGYKLLCAVPQIEQKFEGSSIIKPDAVSRVEEQTTSILFVLDVGPDAYGDKEKFPGGPWCQKGDFVLVRTYSGTRFKVHGKEFRLLNDDQIDGVVDDPRGYTRA